MKEPHNYRKVGYSMIAISVSLVAIGLLVWAIGSNYHFATNLMAGQEIDAMTPKQGYNIISFDHTAPVSAKLKLLDHTDSINETKKLQDQYQQSVNGLPILIFGNSRDNNLDLLAHAEVSAMTPVQGYNVVFFNHEMPVGAKLSLSSHDDLLVNATDHEQKQVSANKDPDISVIILSSSYEDNLKTVLGSGSSVSNVVTSIPQNASPMVPTNVQPTANTSVTITNNGNESAAITKLNTTNDTLSPQTEPEPLTLTEKVNVTLTNVNQTTVNGTNKSVNLNESIDISSK